MSIALGSSHSWSFACCAWLALALAGALGCESRVSLGAPCEVGGCPDPYVCTFGRCRVECSEAGDCASPLECLLVGNVGGCRVPEDGACSPGASCGPGLDCIDSRCAQPCTSPDQCASAQTCAIGGACARLPVDGLCDPLGGSCPAGQTCTATGCESLVVSAMSDGGLFAPCDVPTQCRDGLACANPRCLRACQRGADGAVLTSCGSGSYCAGSEVSGGPPLSNPAGYCTQPCDPLASGIEAGCPADFNCGVAVPNSNTYTTCEPMALTGGARWGRCDNQMCRAGLDCIYGIVAEPRCFAWCEGDGDCEAARERCDLGPSVTVLDQTGTARRVGVCRPRCETAQDCETRLDLMPGSVACTMGVCVRS